MKFRSINFLKYVLCILLASLAVLSCKKDNPIEEPDEENKENVGNGNGDENGNGNGNGDGNGDENGNGNEGQPTVYNLSLEAESEFYQVEFPETCPSGEEVTVKVTPVENVYVNELRFNNRKAFEVEGSENTFRFTMPERDVTLAVVSSSIITVEESDYFAGFADKEIAQIGETVTVTFVTLYAEDVVKRAVVNNKLACTPAGTDIGIYTFEFKMPEGPAVVTGELAGEYHIIEREWDDHCVVGMLDCINHQGTPQEFCSQVAGKLVHFKYTWDLGYDVECKVTGLKTGTDYTGDVFWSVAADNHLYQDCWAFTMPDEPVLIKATSAEKKTYAGQSFTGNYKGYWVALGDNNIITSSQASMNLDLRESAAYFVTSTDANAYDFAGLYSYENGQFTYDTENCRGDYAVRGEILDDGYAFAIVDYLLVNNVTNRKFFLVGKNNFEFVCASDSNYGTRFLLEANEGGSKKWYFVERDNNSIKEAQVSFSYGSTLGESCEAMVTVPEGMSFNGETQFKYTYQSGGTPVFTYRGKEAGTYTSDKGETLVLDGFGGATYNGTNGTYVMNDGIATFTANNGKETRFNTNVNNKTFTVIAEATNTQLYSKYSTTAAKINIDGAVSENGIVEVRINSNYSGGYSEGYAFIGVYYMKDGRKAEMTATSRAYVIDEASRTITISEVLQGCIKSDGYWGTTRIDVVLKYSDDFKTLTIVNDKITATDSPYIYCYGGAVLNAVE